MKEKRVHAKWQQNWAHDGWSEKSYYLSLELLCQGQALALIESQLYLSLANKRGLWNCTYKRAARSSLRK
jgi:hypothetical protein